MSASVRPSYLRPVPGPEIIGAAQSAGAPVIEEDPAADLTQITVEVEDDGAVSIEIGGTGTGIGAPPRDTSFGANLAESLDAMGLAALASYLLEAIESDIQSRAGWEETVNKVARYLGIKLNDPASSVSADGTVCQAVSTVMLEAATKLWGTARAELLPVGGPVKVRRDVAPMPAAQGSGIMPGAPGAAPPAMGHNGGPPLDQPAGSGDDLAAALEMDLNHYLTVTDKEYYPDTSRMLFSRALVGMAFKKVYRCPLRRRPVSVWVMAENLIVSNDCSHLSGAGRITERIKMRQATMRRMQVSGHYRDVPLVQPTGQTTETEEAIADAEGVTATPMLPADYEHTVYEVYCELGTDSAGGMLSGMAMLDEDEEGRVPGFPLPYRVTIDVDSREILEIRRNWKPDDPDYNARRTYVKYGFVPGLGFYDSGLIHLVGNPTQAATMIQRATVDGSLFANFPGGLILQGVSSQQENTVFRPNPGQFIPVKGFTTGNTKITDLVMPMPYKEPSAQQLALLNKFEADVRRLTGIIEIPVGEGMAQVPVGTMMSYIEAITQVPGAVHKDDHISQQEEFELLRALLAEEPEVLTRGMRNPARQAWTREALLAPELVPASDPNTPSQIHRLMKVQGLVQLGAQQQFAGVANNRAIYEHAVRVLADDNSSDFVLPPAPAAAPPPDPRIQAAQIKATADQAKAQAQAQTETMKVEAKKAEIAAKAQNDQADRQSEEVRAALDVTAAKVKAQADMAKVAASHSGQQAQGALDRAHEAQQAGLDRMHDTANQIADRAQDDRHHQDDIAAAAAAAARKPAGEGNS